MPPLGVGPGIVDAPLPPTSMLTVGYGDSSVYPWQFNLNDRDKKDVGFFKLFLSTIPADLSCILQKSPFEKARAGALVALQDNAPKLWATQLVTVIQVEGTDE